MQLIGMLDSPYVRRVAICLQLLRLPFTHNPLSVFRTFAQFQKINPVVKAPTLVCDDGTVLMDSTLIIDYAQSLSTAHRKLLPDDPRERLRALRITGLALAACEKSVQVLYERNLRTADKQDAVWMARVSGQAQAAFAELDRELARQPLAASSETIDQAGVIAAVAWHFTQAAVPGVLAPDGHPALQAHASAAEALPQFRAAPHGAGTYPVVTPY
jgi:glutathione S-transferase